MNFTQIPNSIVDDPGISTLDKTVLLVLYRYAYGSRTTAFPSQRTIARSLGVKKLDTIRKALRRLELGGYARRIGYNKRNVAEYNLTEPTRETVTPRQTGGVSRRRTDGVPTRGTGGHNNTGQNTYNNTTTDQDKTYDHVIVAYDHDTDDDDDIGSEAELSQAGDARPGVEKPALPAPAPTSGSGAIPCGMGSEARSEAERLDLSVQCPDDPDLAMTQIRQFVRECGGEYFNRGSLEALVAECGLERAWAQAAYLKQRLALMTEPLRNGVTGFFLGTVRAKRGRQHDPRISAFSDQVVNQSINLVDVPFDLTQAVVQDITERYGAAGLEAAIERIPF